MNRRFFLLGTVALVPACGMMPGQNLALAPNSTLIVTRHADRNGEDLNARGRERARALVEAVKDFDIDLIFSPGIKRNLDTAAPLAAHWVGKPPGLAARAARINGAGGSLKTRHSGGRRHRISAIGVAAYGNPARPPGKFRA